MAETKIEWADYSFNAWWGCTKVSPACDHCYAEIWAKRTGFPNLWGVDAGRRTFGAHHWVEPLKWNAKAPVDGPRPRVFCNSMADVFDNHPDVFEPRRMLWDLIRQTRGLDWLILTKRIGNVERMLPADWGPNGYPNVWLGISVCNQPEADRDIVKLLRIPAVVQFLSVEPMLGPLRLDQRGCGSADDWDEVRDNAGIGWVICGGESGRGARPMNLQWAQNLRAECAAAHIPFFMKQMSQADTVDYKHFKSFPEFLRVREWPAQ